MISIENVDVRINNKHLLRNINLKISKGSVYALMGYNGAGKTMLLKLLMGIVTPDNGTITFNGDALGPETKSEIFQHIGVLIETPPLYGYLTVYQNLLVKQKMLSLAPASILRAIEFCNLSEHTTKKISEISLGTKQRLGLALAFLANPDLIILDEPSSTLDPKAAADFRKLVKAINSEFGTTFLIASHNLEEVEEIATHLCFLKKGEVIIADTLVNIKKNKRLVVKHNPLNADELSRLLRNENIPLLQYDDKVLITTCSDEEYNYVTTRLQAANIPYESPEMSHHHLKDFFYAI